MSIRIIGVSHVNVTVPAELEQAAKDFYGELLGLEQIPKPAGPRQFIGAWYEVGSVQLHLSIEENPQNVASERHVCYLVEDLATAERELRNAGFEIVTEDRGGKVSSRFFVRDPAGNRIEMAERPTG